MADVLVPTSSTLNFCFALLRKNAPMLSMTCAVFSAPSLQALVFVGGPAAVVLLVAGLTMEGPAWAAAGGWALVAQHAGTHAAAYSASFAVNLLCYLAILHTSGLTFKA